MYREEDAALCRILSYPLQEACILMFDFLCAVKSCETVLKFHVDWWSNFVDQNRSWGFNSCLHDPGRPRPLWTRILLTVFTVACWWNISWARWIQC